MFLMEQSLPKKWFPHEHIPVKLSQAPLKEQSLGQENYSQELP